MALESVNIPDQFAAGTTVRYRRRLAEYPPSSGWTLRLYLAGASVLAKTAAPDGEDFLVTIEASDTAGDFAAGLYKWVERVTGAGGEVYEVGRGTVTVLPNLADATEGSEQEWLERAVAMLRAHVEGRLPTGMESYQIAGRVVAKMPIKEAIGLLTSLESRLASLHRPDFTRPVLVSFTKPGFDR